MINCAELKIPICDSCRIDYTYKGVRHINLCYTVTVYNRLNSLNEEKAKSYIIFISKLISTNGLTKFTVPSVVSLIKDYFPKYIDIMNAVLLLSGY